MSDAGLESASENLNNSLIAFGRQKCLLNVLMFSSYSLRSKTDYFFSISSHSASIGKYSSFIQLPHN
jgi:hypothetical protein